MSNILNSEDFGLKIYNRFPPKYREDDVEQKFALKRYIEASSDGGFKYAISDINGITNLIDPDKVDSKVLPILFKQYGLELFNGIPEEYLRYLLPKLGDAWSKKGSLGVIEFITSSLSGIKTSTEVVYDEQDNPLIEVTFEMDYNIGNYFPNTKQFEKLLVNFVPFYCDVAIMYAYMFYEKQVLEARFSDEMHIQDSKSEDGLLSVDYEHVDIPIIKYLDSVGLLNEYVTHNEIKHDVLEQAKIRGIDDLLEDKSLLFYGELGILNKRNIPDPRRVAVVGEAIAGKSVLSYCEDFADTYKDSVVESIKENGGLLQPIDSRTNTNYNTLNGRFFTNGIHSFDIITIGGERTIIFN